MPLALRSVDLWAEIDKRLEARLEYDRRGDLRIVETEADAEKVRAIAARERGAGLTLEWVQGQALRSLVPTLSPSVLGGTGCPTGGQPNPLLVAPTLVRRSRDLVSVFLESCPVKSLCRDGAGFALETQNGQVRAARLVLTAGAWTPSLAAQLGLHIPIS